MRYLIPTIGNLSQCMILDIKRVRADLIMKMPVPFEPKRKNRWLLRFPSDLGIQEWWLASASRPSINQSEVEIPFLNTSTWVIGRFIWEAINVTFRDPIW